METSVSKGLAGLSEKIGRLVAQRNEALERLKKADDEITTLRRDLREAEERLRRSQLDVEFLSLSHKLADTPDALAEARKTVRRILAGVERAISLLKEDARI